MSIPAVLSSWISVDGRDVFYLVAGLAFFGLAVLPRLRHVPFLAAPPLCVGAGALVALSSVALPLPHPLGSALDRKVIEHASEIIVIVSLKGAGLAIDKRPGWRAWSPVWPQLLVTMPLTIAAMALGGLWIGLPLATALLLAASLAPTDPVLARAVQVGGPTHGDGSAVQLGLTGEAGLNDGLAFPFVYLAIAVAGLGAIPPTEGDWTGGWLWHWLGFDVVYRIAMAVAVGHLFGRMTAGIVFSAWGDAGGRVGERGENAGLTVMAATFACYGLTEILSAYGFLAVFVSALSGRSYSRGQAERDPYVLNPHRFSDQIEALLLALLLLWFGGQIATGLLSGLRPGEVMLALALVFVVRPLAGWMANARFEGPSSERLAISVFGIRGMGTIFYLAYGANHAPFDNMASAWRIAATAILCSIVLHGVSAPIAMRRIAERKAKTRKP